MLPAPTLTDVLRRADMYGRSQPLQDRLVSIVFAEPASLVISDLRTNRELWDEMTGESWDLFFAGYYQFGSHGDTQPTQVDRHPERDDAWRFSPNRFREFLMDIEGAMIRSREDRRWRFSGTADLVSFMVYGGEPDWASLHAVELTGTASPYGALPTLGRAVEGLRRWQDEEPEPQFAPGEVRLGPFVPREALRQALLWTALAAAGGIIGNRADDILTHLLS
jgi:hypothetical protein